MSESHFHRAIVKCPRCLSDLDAVIWDAVDAGADPDLKERLLQKKIQQQVCLNCGNEFILAEPLLYRDDARQLLVYYAPAGQTGGSAADETGGPANGRAGVRPGGFPGAPAGLGLPEPSGLAGWHLRLVNDYNSLIETIHIHDHFCDDRLMAVVKIAIQTQGCLDPEPKAIHFLTADDTTMRFVAMTEDGGWFTVDFPPDIYTNTESVFQNALPPDSGWLTVDTEYGARLVREQTDRLAEGSGSLD